jgi:hypothetical protein
MLYPFSQSCFTHDQDHGDIGQLVWSAPKPAYAPDLVVVVAVEVRPFSLSISSHPSSIDPFLPDNCIANLYHFHLQQPAGPVYMVEHISQLAKKERVG